MSTPGPTDEHPRVRACARPRPSLTPHSLRRLCPARGDTFAETGFRRITDSVALLDGPADRRYTGQRGERRPSWIAHHVTGPSGCGPSGGGPSVGGPSGGGPSVGWPSGCGPSGCGPSGCEVVEPVCLAG